MLKTAAGFSALVSAEQALPLWALQGNREHKASKLLGVGKGHFFQGVCQPHQAGAGAGAGGWEEGEVRGPSFPLGF